MPKLFAGNDRVEGWESSPFPDPGEILKGYAGNDVILGYDGHDDLDGGAGTDLAVITRYGAAQALTLDLTNPAVLHTLADGTKLIGVERLDFGGGTGADQITGGALVDTPRGEAAMIRYAAAGAAISSTAKMETTRSTGKRTTTR